jgi:hypothetical protein
MAHIVVSENRLLRTVTSPRFRELGLDAYVVWKSLPVDPDDFILIDTEDLFRAVPADRFPDLVPWLHHGAGLTCSQ